MLKLRFSAISFSSPCLIFLKTQEWSEAETLAVLTGAKSETEDTWLAYSENFFFHGFQDERRNSEEMQRILGNLENSAKVGNEVAGAVLGYAILNTFERLQVVEDGLSYLTRAAKIGIPGAAQELCLWYADRILKDDLDTFEDADVGVDDCYDATVEHPRVHLPQNLEEAAIRVLILAGCLAQRGQLKDVIGSVYLATNGVCEVPEKYIERFEDKLLEHCESDVDEAAISYAAMHLWTGSRKRTIRNAVKILECGAANGSVSACAFLGGALFEGVDGTLKRDYKRAYTLLSKAAEANDALAKYYLARCYGDGLGVEKDEAKSAQLMLDAAEAKILPALVDVGRSLVEGARDENKNDAIRRGCEMIRYAAEEQDYPPAWEAMLEYHEKKIGPFKTNKFRRAAKEALARLDD